MTTDAPIVAFDADRFGRGAFARQIARTIAAQRESSSLVVGLYGPWGDGKTSVLNLVERAVDEDDTVVTIRFNPWQLGDEAQVFRGFFTAVAVALDAKLTTGKEKVRDALLKYSGLLKPVPIAGDALQTMADTAAKAISDGSADLGVLKSRVDDALGKSGKRVVILMDDLDRLDKSEIQTIFRLVKVAADFQHTAYVLAFDEAVVTDALQDRYATGSIHGVNFLEKIVQLPLHLPPVSKTALLELTLESVQEALDQADIELTQEQVNQFVMTFQRAVAPRVKTPRVGKRYGNAVKFVLPMIGKETNPVDLLLFEAMRIFYPLLYDWVRAHREAVLGEGYAQGDERNSLTRSGFDEATKGMPDAEAEGAKVLLTYLFPRTESAWQNKAWGTNWDRTWAKEKRVCSPHHFDRYVTYVIPAGDISDADVEQLLTLLGDDATKDAAYELAARLIDQGAERLLQKLNDQLSEIGASAATNAALRLGSVDGSTLDDRSQGLQLSILEPTALLTSKLLQQVDKPDRDEAAKALVQTAEPLAYAIELGRDAWTGDI